MTRPRPFNLYAELQQLEEMLIREALAEAKGNGTQAAKLLGIKRSTLWQKIQKLGIDPKGPH